MTALRYAIAGAALALVAASAPARQQPQPLLHPLAPPVQRTLPQLPQTRTIAADYVRSGKIPAIVVLAGHGDAPAQIVAAGRIDDLPNARFADRDSLWRVYSMTKPITAMAAMMLIEEGRIGLDQPVSDFIPAFRHMRVQLRPDSLDSRPATRPITIRNLLTHTAGLGYTITTRGPLLQAYEEAGLVPFTQDVRTEARVRQVRPPTLAAFADRVATLPLIAEPGTKWSYSIGLDVLGRVIEVAGRMPFDRFLQRRIFDPLGMRSSYFTVPPSDAARLATGYALFGTGRVPLDPGPTSVFLTAPSFPYGGAGLVTSAADYDRFLHMLQDGGSLDGVRILKPATVRLALSNLLPPGVFYLGAAATGPQGFGAGGSVTLRDVPGGPAKGAYGWSGAAGTIAWVDPARQVRATIMVNYLPPDRWPLRAELTRSVYADFAADAGAPPPSSRR